MKTGIFGGAFNPVHNGHISLCKGFWERLNLDRVLLIPSGQSPHKSSNCLAPAKDRLNMCRLAAEQFAFIEVCSDEIDRPGKSYTVDTLTEISNRYPDDELYLIIGADMLLSFHEWKDYKKILSLCTLCAAPRNGDDIAVLSRYALSSLSEFGNVAISDLPLVDISSTQIRNTVSVRGNISSLVPEGVAEYIYKNKLYAESECD